MATAPMGTTLQYICKLARGAAAERSDRQLLDDFADRGDEAAFAAIVARYGAMVLRVCRRLLGHEQDQLLERTGRARGPARSLPPAARPAAQLGR